MAADRIEPLVDLLDIASRILHSRGHSHGLYPAQWVGLRYFAKASLDRCTASELARYQGLANGAVSRTVRTLIEKGYLRKADNQPKGRAEYIELTTAGRDLLQHDPLSELKMILAQLSDLQKESLAVALEAVIRIGGGGESQTEA